MSFSVGHRWEVLTPLGRQMTCREDRVPLASREGGAENPSRRSLGLVLPLQVSRALWRGQRVSLLWQGGPGSRGAWLC